MKKTYALLFFFAFSSCFAQLNFSPRGIGGGGALFSPSINPANTSEYYISCDMSELFHTTDFGLNYSQVHFNEFSGGHNSKVCFTSTPNLLYSISYINDIGTPVKSTDNGQTWTVLTGNPDDETEVYTIHVNYSNPNHIVISWYDEIYYSSNGGSSFTSIHTASSGSGNVVGGVFFESTHVYIGTNDGVLHSANSGSTWSMMSISGLSSSERIWSFAAAKAGATTRFFCLTGDVADVYVGLQGSDYYGFFRGVYTFDVGGSAWASVENDIAATDFPMFIDMAENDINTVYMAGSNDSGEPTIFKTTDAGANWTNTFITANNQNITTGWSGYNGDRGWSYGECPFGFDVASTNPQVVIFGDFGFCHKTSNGGTSWSQAYVSTSDQNSAGSSTPKFQDYTSIGIENTTCWQIHWVNASTMWACYSDIRGLRSTDAGEKWSFNYTGNNANSTYRIVQATNGTLYAGSSNIHDMYQSTRLSDGLLDATDANGKIIFSTNDGLTWQDLHVFNHPVFWIALDPNNSNRAYASVIHYNGGAGVGGIYRCDNLSSGTSSTWTLLPDPPRTEKHPACLVVLNDGKLVATYSGRRTTVFTASSGVFVYDPTGNSWSDVSDAGMHYWTKDIVVDPNDASQNTWYVSVFSGWGGAPNGLGGLYKTTNRGVSWTKLTGTTLDRVTSCTFNPNNADEIYLTTEYQGLWKCSNINAVTPVFTQEEAYPFRQPERVFFNPYNTNELWVSSFGNGMKKALLNNTTSVYPVTAKSNFSLYPNPASGAVQLMSSEMMHNATVRIYSLNGVLMSKHVNISGINALLELNNLHKGIYVVEISNTGKTERMKLVMN